MARQINRLTARGVAVIKTDGMYPDGDGLYFVHGPNGSRRWIFIYRLTGKRREMGLGSAGTVSLAEARRLREEARQLIAQGLDPIEERKRVRTAIAPAVGKTFGEVLTMYVEAHGSSWKNDKHIRQWRNDIPRLMPAFCSLPIDAITTDHVVRALTPIWAAMPETAQRNRERMERVLDFAGAIKMRSGKNPAVMRGNLEYVLPSIKSRPKRQGTIPFAQVPAFLQRLRSKLDVSAYMLEFLILSASRTTPILEARWVDIDLAHKVWNIPGEHMKNGEPHRVPLTQRMIEILEIMRPVSGTTRWLFINRRTKQRMSEAAMLARVKGLGYPDATVHGFRASFRTWLCNATPYKGDLGELALAHKVSSDVVRAYLSDDALEERRPIMRDWDAFVTQRS